MRIFVTLSGRAIAEFLLEICLVVIRVDKVVVVRASVVILILQVHVPISDKGLRLPS